MRRRAPRKPAPEGAALTATGEVALIAVACGGWFLVGVNISLVPPLLSFIAADLRLSSTVQGLLVAALPLGSFLGNVLFGPLIDRVGSRRTFAAGALGAAVALAATAMLPSGPVATGLRVLTGLLMPLVGVSVFSLIGHYVREARRATAIGYVTAAGSVANMVTVPAVVLIAGYVSWQSAFVVVAALAAVLGAVTLAAVPPRPAPDTGAARSWLLTLPRSSGVRACVAVFALFTFGQFVVVSLYPTWLLHNLSAGGGSVDRAGLLFLVSGSVMVVAAASTGVLSRRAGRLLFGVVLGAPAVVVLLLPTAPGAYGVQMAAYAALAGLQALAFPLLRARANELAAGDLSRTNASINAGYQIAATTAGMVGALLFSATPSFWLNAVVAAAAFLAALAVFTTARDSVAMPKSAMATIDPPR